MKLYATTTSERASKGQGGNEYLYIEILNENKNKIGTIAILPTKRKDVYEIDYSFGYGIEKIADGIARVERLKGKSQKGEKIKLCKECGEPREYIDVRCKRCFTEF